MVTTLAGLAIGYGVIAGLAYAFQDQLLFQPGRRLTETPDRAGMDYETVRLETADEETLHGWWIPAPGGADDARGTLLFFHGNAGTISGRVGNVRQFHDLGLNVLIVDYRGYGESTGTPSEQGLYRDAEAVWRHATEARGIAPSDLVLFGRSMGGGPAAWLAARTEPAAVILESTFTNVPDVAAHHYPFLPVRALATNAFDTLARVDEFGAPLLVIHSRSDEIVPFELGRRIYEAAPEPKQFLEIEGSHNNGWRVSAPRYTRALDRFLGDVLDR
jgi:hypothetical protein